MTAFLYVILSAAKDLHLVGASSIFLAGISFGTHRSLILLRLLSNREPLRWVRGWVAAGDASRFFVASLLRMTGVLYVILSAAKDLQVQEGISFGFDSK